MPLAHDTAYQAVLARDARFDGRLFVGVTSTGIYCRPICRVRPPKSANCRFFETQAQAEAESFRPCLKCRPEISPGPGLAWTTMDASRTLALQAARLLDARLAHGEDTGVAGIAGEIGVSDRHLRRIFQSEHGVSPVQYVQTRRLLMAKQLLTDTRLPIAQVALASGFASLRRFNAAFAENYRMSPTRLRGEAADDLPGGDEAITVTLGYRAPYAIDRLTRFLAKRAVARVEQVESGRIRRTLRAGIVDDAAGWIEAQFVAERSQLRLSFAPQWAASSAHVLASARRWLDLDASPGTIDEALRALPGGDGLRLPGAPDAFELAVRAVLGQQVTVAAARTLAKRFVERFGEAVETPWPEIDRAFPSPETVAATPVERIAELGIIRTRAHAIIAIARGWAALVPMLRTHQPTDELIAQLCALPGIGPWTAHYIAMRALGWPDAFPPQDVAVLKAMKTLFNTASQREAEAAAEAFRPWRSYAVLRLWDSLENPT
jgi:AraC family transcriptional regulator of adaptative response / DNA-3-methyladenine glycosylase II